MQTKELKSSWLEASTFRARQQPLGDIGTTITEQGLSPQNSFDLIPYYSFFRRADPMILPNKSVCS